MAKSDKTERLIAGVALVSAASHASPSHLREGDIFLTRGGDSVGNCIVFDDGHILQIVERRSVHSPALDKPDEDIYQVVELKD